MTSFATNFIKLDKLKLSSVANSVCTKPSYYHNKDCFIIATHSENNVPGIYKYNINTNKINLIYKYEDMNFRRMGYGQCINEDILYVFGGYCSSRQFFSFNLKTKEISYDKSNELHKCDLFPETVNITSPINEIHIIDNDSQHFKFKNDDKSIIRLNNQKLKKEKISSPKLLYIESRKQLFLLGGYQNDKILYCDISQNSIRKDYEWKLHKLKLPYTPQFLSNYDVLLGLQNIIFLFYFPGSIDSSIWCMDIIRYKWHKSKLTIPDCFNFIDSIYVLKGKDNFVHIVDFEKGHHFMISLYDLIPSDLKKIYSNYYKPLIIGYIKQMEHKHIIPTIPYVLKILIWNYFPSLM